MQKLYSGNHGEDGDGWIKIGQIGKFDGVKWSIYRKPQPNGSEWDYVKVVADGKAPRKANYWLSWNGDRFAIGGDFLKMLEHRKDMYDEVISFMSEVDA